MNKSTIDKTKERTLLMTLKAVSTKKEQEILTILEKNASKNPNATVESLLEN